MAATPHRPPRRFVALGLPALAAAPWLLASRLAAAQARRPTPSQTEGPFYPVAFPTDSDFDLLKNGNLAYAKGEPVWLSGTVTDVDGKPLRGGQVEIWQADADGHYLHPRDGGKSDPAFQSFGRVQVGGDGTYRFRTIKPVPYTGRTPHIHVKVRLGKRELLTTQVYVEGHPGNARDFLWRNMTAEERAVLAVPFTRSTDGLTAAFHIVVQGA